MTDKAKTHQNADFEMAPKAHLITNSKQFSQKKKTTE